MSHDQDFQLVFFPLKCASLQKKITEHHCLISGGNFSSPRQARPPLHKLDEENYMFILCFRVSSSLLVLAKEKRRWNKTGSEPLPIFLEHVPSFFLLFEFYL